MNRQLRDITRLSCDQLVSKLQEALPKLLAGRPVTLAYLHGSSVREDTHPFSDVDIALVTDGPLAPKEQLRLILELQVDLADRCEIGNLDVRVINAASIVFRGRVVTDGRLVYARSEDARVEFEVSTRLRYFDYLPTHREMQAVYFNRVRERGLYG